MSENDSNEIITPYLSEDISLKKRTPFHAQWEIFKIRSWRILAHHPTCSRYENHFFKIGSFHFCIGCSMIYSALLIYLILFLTIPSVFRFNVWVTASLPFAGFGLAIIHRLFKLKNKWLKAFSRFTAGFGIGAYCALMIQTLFVPKRWWLAFILAVLLLLGNQLYGISRGANANRKRCVDCPLRTQDPPCNPERNTNIRVRKIYSIVEEELQKAKEHVKKPAKN
ncbi:MAG: hypothetical protein FK730_15750 [Asgard group archaeon]|nr:hypothetical protein [Asgard group archaeon]